MTFCLTFSYSVPMHVMRKYNAQPQRICIFFVYIYFIILWKSFFLFNAMPRRSVIGPFNLPCHSPFTPNDSVMHLNGVGSEWFGNRFRIHTESFPSRISPKLHQEGYSATILLRQRHHLADTYTGRFPIN